MIGDYKCLCPAGYSGRQCEVSDGSPLEKVVFRHWNIPKIKTSGRINLYLNDYGYSINKFLRSKKLLKLAFGCWFGCDFLVKTKLSHGTIFFYFADTSSKTPCLQSKTINTFYGLLFKVSKIFYFDLALKPDEGNQPQLFFSYRKYVLDFQVINFRFRWDFALSRRVWIMAHALTFKMTMNANALPNMMDDTVNGLKMTAKIGILNVKVCIK